MTPPHPTSLAAGALLALATTACGTSAMQTNAPPQGGHEERPNETQRGAARPVPRRNPNPNAYEVTMRIEGAPGPFHMVQGVMQYETALDDPCMPRIGGMSGTRMRLKERVPIEWQAAGPGLYRAIVSTDLLMDEDYFDLGVCRWTMVDARVEMRASEGAADTTFFDGLTRADLEAARSRTFYFWSGLYPTAAPGNINQPGQEDPAKFKPAVRDQLFKVTLSPRKVTR